MRWLERRPMSKPFFLMLNYKAVHSPWQYAKRHEMMYKDEMVPEPSHLNSFGDTYHPNGIPKFQSRIHDTINSYKVYRTGFKMEKREKGSGQIGSLNLMGKQINRSCV